MNINTPNKYRLNINNSRPIKILSYQTWVDINYHHINNMYDIMIDNIKSNNLNIIPDFGHFCEMLYKHSNKDYKRE